MRRVCNLVSPFVNHNSIAKVGRNLVKSLVSMYANFAILDMSDEFDNIPLERERNLIKMLNRTMIAELSVAKNIVFNADPQTIVKYSFPYEYIPYFSLFTNGVPRRFLQILDSNESIFVYNEYTRNVLQECNITPEKIKVINPSIDSRRFMKAEPFGINGKRSYAFLSVLESSNNSEWTQILHSFYRSFSADEDVCLVLKVNDREYTKYFRMNLARLIDSERKKYGTNVPPVILISDSMTDDEMASIYADCDCYVKISGVNSGLSFIEAFASGLVCIGPEKGGCSEILNRKTGFTVRKRGEQRISNETMYDGITYNVYDEEHLSEIMRWVFDNSENLKEKTYKERKLILSRFDYNLVGQSFLKSLR